MFLANLTYVKPLSEVDRYLEEHVAFLDRYYATGQFICSGRKTPRVGGVILCRAKTLEEMQGIIQNDPFFQHKIADYELIEFTPSKCADGFRCFLEETN